MAKQKSGGKGKRRRSHRPRWRTYANKAVRLCAEARRAERKLEKLVGRGDIAVDGTRATRLREHANRCKQRATLRQRQADVREDIAYASK